MNTYIAQSASLVMIASLNDVAAFMTPEKKPMLVGEDSCSRCITQGHTYVFNKQKNDAPYFESYVPGGDTFPEGQCCDVTDRNVDCETTRPAQADLLWETLAFKGIAAGDEACKLIPKLQEITFRIYAQSPARASPRDAFSKLFTAYDDEENFLDYLGGDDARFECFRIIRDIILQLIDNVDVPDHALPTLGGWNLPKTFDMLQEYLNNFGSEDFLEVFKELVKLLTPYVPGNQVKERQINDLIRQAFLRVTWKWAVSWSPDLQSDEVSKAQTNLDLILEFEGPKVFVQFRDNLIKSYQDYQACDGDQYCETMQEQKLEKIFDIMDTFAYFFDKIEVREISILRRQLEALEPIDPELYEDFYSQLQEIKSNHRTTIFNATTNNLLTMQVQERADAEMTDKFEDLATWVYFTNSKGIQRVNIFRDLLVKYDDDNQYFPAVKELRWVRQYLEEGRYLDYFGHRFESLLETVYYGSIYGREAYNKLQRNAYNAIHVGLYPELTRTEYSESDVPLFDEFEQDVLAGSTCKFDELKKEIDFWFFWFNKFSPEGTHEYYKYFYKFNGGNTYDEEFENLQTERIANLSDDETARMNAIIKVVSMKDKIDQLLEAPANLVTPYNGDRDYFDPRKFNEIAASLKDQLERARVTDDGLAFEQIYNEGEVFSKKIYDEFFDDINLAAADLEDNKVKLNELRLLYGNEFTNDLTKPGRSYDLTTQDKYDDFIDTLIYIHEKFGRWNNIAKEGDEDMYDYKNEYPIIDLVKKVIKVQGAFNPSVGNEFNFQSTIDEVTNDSYSVTEKKIAAREALAHEFWRVQQHNFGHSTLSSGNFVDSDEETEWGFEEALAEALLMKEEALRNYYSPVEIDINLKFYGVLELIEDKLTLTRNDVDTNADFTYLMAYKDKIENLVKREPWMKRKIQNDFYNDLLKFGQAETNMSNISNDIIFYLNDVVRYNIFFGSKRITTLIEQVLEIQKVANQQDWDMDIIYSEDLLGERFSFQANNEITKAYFIEQEKIIQLYYKHFEATGSQKEIFEEVMGFEVSFQLFYEVTRTLLTHDTDSIKEKGTEHFNDLVMKFHQGGKQYPLFFKKTEHVFIDMFFYRFGLLKYWQYMQGAFDNLDIMDPSHFHGYAIEEGLSYMYGWLHALNDDFENQADYQYKAIFTGNIFYHFMEGTTDTQRLMASKIMLGYTKTEIRNEPLEALVADSTEYNDVFLLRSAYSMLQKDMDDQKEEFTRDLMRYYDFAINTHTEGGNFDYTDKEFYTDPTYTRTIAHRIIDLYYKAKEQARTQAAYYPADGEMQNNQRYQIIYSDNIEGDTGDLEQYFNGPDKNQPVDVFFQERFFKVFEMLTELNDVCSNGDDNQNGDALRTYYTQLKYYADFAGKNADLEDNTNDYVLTMRVVKLFEEFFEDVKRISDCDFDYAGTNYLKQVTELTSITFEDNMKADGTNLTGVQRNSVRTKLDKIITKYGWNNLFLIANNNVFMGDQVVPYMFKIVFGNLSDNESVQLNFSGNQRREFFFFIKKLDDDYNANLFPLSINGGLSMYSPVVGSSPIQDSYMGLGRLRNYANSRDFAANDLALTSCPSRTEVCGRRNVILEDQYTVPIKMNVDGFNGATDSCHWLVKAECDLPSVEITQVTPMMDGEFTLKYLEYQEDGPDVQMDLDESDYPRFASVPEYIHHQYNYPEGELGELVYDQTDYPAGITFEERQEITKFHKYIWASVIESEVERVLNIRNMYYEQLARWEKRAVEYNEQIADIENLIESLDNQGWIHQVQVGTQGLVEDVLDNTDLFSKKVAEMVDALPTCPGKPVAPPVDINISLEGAKFISGFGTLTAGEISVNARDLNTRKSFGVFGQGKGNMKGFTIKPDIATDGENQCRARYIALNLVANRRSFVQEDGDILELTASAEPNSVHKMEKPGPPRKSKPAECHEFTPGAQFFIDTLGAASLGVAASMATLAAFTLY